MILYAMRWPHDRAADDRVASRFFPALGALVGEWASSPHPFHLPVARSPELEKATAFVWEHLGEPLGVERVAKAAATSVRTLARRFESELSLSFRAYLGAARMLYAMDRLAQRDARVTDIALEVGFASPSAFTAAFTEFVGEPPTAYRARLGP
jgi:AraC-like DNA-binding protein